MRQKLKLILLIIIGYLLSASVAWAAGATVSGKITDAQTGEPLIGANVLLTNTTIGAATDLEGRYFLRGIAPGTYTLRVSYIAYESTQVDDLILTQNDHKVVDVVLQEQVLTGQNVVVEARVKTNTDATLLLQQKNSLNSEDGISASQISRSGDSNAADALKRVTGVSVTDGKYINVRGLGDRYANAVLNGAPVASPEPERKAIPLDMFPAALLESITAYKTFTPDLPGIFAGGLVNIRTKAYPDNRVMNSSFSTKYRPVFTNSTRFLLSSGGSYDYFGYDDGSRRLPDAIPQDDMLNLWSPPSGMGFDEWRQILGQYGTVFNHDFRLNAVKPASPISFGWNFGNKYNPNTDWEYGFFTNLNFGNDYNYQVEEHNQYARYGDQLATTHTLTNYRSTYKTNLGAGVSTGFTWKQHQKIKLFQLYTHNSANTVIYTEGQTPNVDRGVFIKENYSEKSIWNSTLSGEHRLPGRSEQRLDWKLNLSISHLSEPDIKSHNYAYDANSGSYVLVTSSAKAGLRDFTTGRDQNAHMDVNYSTKFRLSGHDDYKFKAGFFLDDKYRSFQIRSFYHMFFGDVTAGDLVVADGDFGSTFSESNFLDSSGTGLILVENIDGAGRNAYQASEQNLAGFAMLEWPLHLALPKFVENSRFIFGVRAEQYGLNLEPYNPVTRQPYTNQLVSDEPIKSEVNELILLPSFSLLTDFSNDLKLRASYAITAARGEFREIAPFEYQEFYGGAVAVGYPGLETTRIYNSDVRLEWYSGPGERMAVSAFSKRFEKPIEMALIETSDLTYKTFQNAENASTAGIEVEVKRHVSQLPEKWGQFSYTLNTTWSRSSVISPEIVTLFNGVTVQNSAPVRDRPLQGQSEWIFNLGLDYATASGLAATLAYNTFSRRLDWLGTGNRPDGYEYPFHSLNLTAGKSFNRVKMSFKANNILDSSVRFGQIEPATGELKLTRSYAPGRSFSLGMTYKF
ncbi:MAG: carboxypeptidase-like regulatory domain-containing protein [Candidatus Marinimicrobia bacterium]|nr:carboxypeptidase-like regulatory domain-containing protein [Candidatus Neomarinimicrobiota bacterium]